MTDRIAYHAQGYAFQEWLRNQVRSDIETPVFPKNKEEIDSYRDKVRKIFEVAAGPVPEYDPLNPEIHQTHQRDGYRIEAVSFSTFAGLRMTATAYVPDVDRPVPGILAVHGHSSHGRRDKAIQRRCVIFAKLGYFVLAVDAIGNGERSVNLPGEYHGNNYAGSLWLTGNSVFGIQIHENFRACDYLSSRPEVDPTKLGINGSSGGGNQSFYSGAWDKRFKAVVPVCSTGAYKKLVGASNCMCETPFGMAGKLEQFDVFALTAPRALYVINAKVDGASFRFEDAQETIQQTKKIWEMLGCPEKVGYKAFPMRHSYPDVAREVCIRWFNRWLKGEEDETTPIKEPDFTIENYDTISCYPRTNHSQVMTIPEFFNKKTEELTQKKTDISIEGIKKVFLTPPKTSLKLEHLTSTKPFTPEIASLLTFFKGDDGTFLTSFSHWPDCNLTSDKALIVVGNNKYDFYSSEKTPETYPIIQQALQNNISVWVVDLPGFGEGQLPGHTINTITSSRACHMIGFTLAGYWISLLQSLAQTIKQSIKTVYLYAIGGPSTAILAGSPLLTEFDKITVVNPVGSYKISNNFMNIPFETLIPNLLTVGDIPDFAGMRAPKPLTVVAPTSNDGSHLSTEEIFKLFSPTIQRYLSMDKGEAFNLLGKEEFKSTFPFYFNP